MSDTPAEPHPSSADSASPQLTDSRIFAESEARFPMGIVSASAWREGAKWARSQLAMPVEPQTAPVASWQATDTPIYSKDEFAAMASGVILTMAEGCCSAINPCSHQQRDPRTICETCKTALSLSRPQRAPQ